MPSCNRCEYPDLCFAFRCAEDHLKNGKLYQIIGCNTEEYLYGEELTKEKIKKMFSGVKNDI